jgi:hypothetical protein
LAKSAEKKTHIKHENHFSFQNPLKDEEAISVLYLGTPKEKEPKVKRNKRKKNKLSTSSFIYRG